MFLIHIPILRRPRTEAMATGRSIKKTYDATLPYSIKQSLAAYGSFGLPGYIRLPSELLAPTQKLIHPESAVIYPLVHSTSIAVNL
jgi:hypothetical protein